MRKFIFGCRCLLKKKKVSSHAREEKGPLFLDEKSNSMRTFQDVKGVSFCPMIKSVKITKVFDYSRVPNKRPGTLINFEKEFHPGRSY